MGSQQTLKKSQRNLNRFVDFRDIVGWEAKNVSRLDIFGAPKCLSNMDLQVAQKSQQVFSVKRGGLGLRTGIAGRAGGTETERSCANVISVGRCRNGALAPVSRRRSFEPKDLF